MAVKLITPAAAYPVTMTEAKAHLNVDFTDHDALIELFLQAATDDAQEFTGRAFVRQTWELVIDEFPASEIRIPKPPLIEVVSLKYDDADGNEQTLADTEYYVDDISQHGWVVPVSTGWPATVDAINAVRIQYIAGYADSGASPAVLADRVPYAIKAAVLLELGSLYAYRETMVVGQAATRMPWSAEQLLRQYRVHIAMA